MELENVKINFLGDSITFGIDASIPERSFLGRLQKKYPCSVFRNYGECGSSIANQHVWDTEPFWRRAGRMDPDADAVVIFGGTNDFGTAVPLGTPDERTADTFYGACYILFDELRRKFPGKPIAVVTPLHRLYESDSEYQGRKLAAPLKEYVRILKETANRFAFSIIDLHTASDLRPSLDVVCGDIMPDGLHPNDMGHKILFEEMDAALRLL